MATIGAVARIACRLARRNPDTLEYFNDAVDYVREAQKIVCGRSDPWDFLQMSAQMTTQPNADVYPFTELASVFQVPAIKRVLSIVDDGGSGGVLQPMHWITLERMSGSTQRSSSGGPTATAWAQIGNNAIRLWPKPSGNQLLGLLAEQKAIDQDSAAEMLIPDEYAVPVCGSWAAGRMWEQHAGTEARLMAARMDSRYTQALTEMVQSHGVVRWPFVTFAEPDFLAHPALIIGGR
jgi:hypothetical protein